MTKGYGVNGVVGRLVQRVLFGASARDSQKGDKAATNYLSRRERRFLVKDDRKILLQRRGE